MAKKAKKRTAKTTVTPTYLPRGASYKMGLHDVVKALKVIEKHGHLNKLVRGSKLAKTKVLVPAATVNFVKDFMVKNKMHNDPVGKHIVNARGPAPAGAKSLLKGGPGGDRFGGCNFG